MGNDSKYKIHFDKYDNLDSYHWNILSSNILKRNILWEARYDYCLMLLKKELNSFRGKQILDLGCGNGVMTYLINRESAKVCGVDSSRLAIRLAKRKHINLGSTAKFKIANACRTQFPDNFFDAVVAIEIIEHIERPDELLREIRRVLKPEGIGLISTPIRLTQKPMDKYHYFEWFKGSFQKNIRKIFPDSKFYFSHPVFWTELYYKSFWGRIIIRVLSLFSNPLTVTRSWRLFRQQYAIVKK